MIGSKLNAANLTAEQMQLVKTFINTDVKADLEENFDARIDELAAREALAGTSEPAMSRETQAVLLKGAYDALMAKSPVKVSEAAFNKNLGKVLDWLANHHIFPKGVTVGVLARKTWGEGWTAGVNYGAEANFYLQNGKFMMTNYALKGGQVGAGSSFNDVEFYFAFCFGACYGGDPRGWYLGMDGAVAGGLGAGMFAEVGIDLSSIFSSLFSKTESFSIEDLYEASTVYAGFGFEEGLGGEIALGLYHYSQIGPDLVLANPGQAINSSMLSSKADLLKP